MKKVSVFVASIFALTSLVGSASATQFKANNDSTATQLCVTALVGNKLAMHNKIKEVGLSKKYVASNIKCNGKVLLAYVEKRGINADAMMKMLDNKATEVSITDVAKLNSNF
ncbi:DUF3718 domain-containing protein [Thalassotalea fusca]